MSRCDELREMLAAGGHHVLDTDAKLKRHFDECENCRRFAKALRAIDKGLETLPALDAPAPLVAETKRAASRREVRDQGTRARNPGVAAALAACIVVAASFPLVDEMSRTSQSMLASPLMMIASSTDSAPMKTDSQSESNRGAGYYLESEASRLFSQQTEGYRDAPAAAAPTPMLMPSEAPAPASDEELPAMERMPNPQPDFEPEPAAESAPMEITEALQPPPVSRQRALDDPAPTLPNAILYGNTAETGKDLSSKEGASSNARTQTLLREVERLNKNYGQRLEESTVESKAIGEQLSDFKLRVDKQEKRSSAGKVGEKKKRADQRGLIAGLKQESAQLANEPAAKPSGSRESRLADEDDAFEAQSPAPASIAPRRKGQSAAGEAGRVALGASTVGGSAGSGTIAPEDSAERELARQYLASRRNLHGVRLQAPTGYWANTYVPGDPDLRLLEGRLQDWDRRYIQASLREQSVLEARARPNWQPFDAPRDSALAAYLHADAAAITGPTRMKVQVGIKGSDRQSGYRPDMNVALVLDLRQPGDRATSAKLRALVMTLAEAKQAGDRFSLIVAGPGGGVVVAPEDFRHGPLVVALKKLFGKQPSRPGSQTSIAQALEHASRIVRNQDDPSAPLGASLVLLASTVPAGSQQRTLLEIVHENAVDGISFSGIAVGPRASLAEIDQLVLAGQGHRRIINTAAEAPKLLDRELYASSRSVARAVRLRIGLAPGVRLIEVLGSHRLDEPAAERVRQVEQSIDQRLARNLGIDADRGEDEAGIQIVIPSFQAGDTHVVLLDVIVDRPGPVADLTIRYKDLVHGRNGVARARLAVDSGERKPGPLEHNVLKNELAYQLSMRARTASQRLAAGDVHAARQELDSFRMLLSGLRHEIPGWTEDPEMLRDEHMLTQYVAVLSQPAVVANSGRHLADSLRYLSYRRLLAKQP